MNVNISFDDQAFRNDPYPIYADMRRNDPITVTDQPLTGRSIMLTRYEDVLLALKDPRFSTDFRRAGNSRIQIMSSKWLPRAFSALQTNMLSQDDPDHRRLRDLVHKAFTPRRLEALTGQIETITHGLLDQMSGKQAVDLIPAFALPLPLTVISEMMGVPEVDRARFHKWSSAFLEIGTGSVLRVLMQYPNMRSMIRFFDRMIADRQAHPQDDLISGLVQAEQDGDRLSRDELTSMIFLLLLAGHETTVNLIANGVLALLEFPDQLELLRENPDLIESAVEELIRYGNPIEQASPRITLEAVELHGRTIPKGTLVWLALASANRDERAFPNADRLDITRQPNRHLGFGMGIHYCLGAPLARMEAQTAISALINRYPNMRLAVPADQLSWRTSLSVRGLRSLPLRLR
jgi:cytochrome P450 PksS